MVVFGGIWLYLVVFCGIYSGILWYLEGGGEGGGGPRFPNTYVCMVWYGMYGMVWYAAPNQMAIWHGNAGPL